MQKNTYIYIYIFFPFATSRGLCKKFPELSATMLLTEGYDPAPVNLTELKMSSIPLHPRSFT